MLNTTIFVIMLCVIMLSVVMLSVVMLSVIMLNVVAFSAVAGAINVLCPTIMLRRSKLERFTL